MHPIDRLRHVARAGDVDPVLLAQEAADALGGLAGDPRALVPSCRRLLEFHPTSTPLWWVCARILGTADVRDAADSASLLLYVDPTADELAASLPASAVVVTAGGPVTIAALEQRPDLEVRLVTSTSRFSRAMRRLSGNVIGYDTTEADDACTNASVVLLEPIAAGPSDLLVDQDQAEMSRAAQRSAVDQWAVLGEGRLLPVDLFESFALHFFPPGIDDDLDLADLEDLAWSTDRSDGRAHDGGAERLEAAAVQRVIGPSGSAHPSVGLRRATCPSPPELLDVARGAPR